MTRRAGEAVAGAAVLLVAALNTASLLAILYTSRTNVVRYALQFAPESARLATPGAGALIVAILFACSAVAWAARRIGCGRFAWSAALALGVRGAWPALIGAAWVLPLLPGEHSAYFALLWCVLAIGWGAGRYVALAVCDTADADCARGAIAREQGDDGELIDETAPPLGREAVFGAVCVAGLALTGFHLWVQVRMHAALQYGAPDVGYYAEMLTNALRGRGLYSEGFGFHYLGGHFSPIFYLMLPLWVLWEDIRLLMALGAVAMMAGGPAVYALARVRAAPRVSAGGLALAWYLYPSVGRVIYGASYGFQPAMIAVPLLMWAFYGYVARRRVVMWVCLVLALCCKEEVALIAAGFGIFAWVRERGAKWGVWLAAGSVALLLVYVLGVGPALHGSGEYSRAPLYAGLGGSPGGMLRTLVSEPRRFAARLGSVEAVGLAATLLVPAAGVALRRWGILLIALPTFALMCLVDERSFATIRFWHQATLLPVIWWATVEAVCAMRRGGRAADVEAQRIGAARRAGWVVAVVVCAALAHPALGFSFASRGWGELHRVLAEQDRSALIAELHRLIPAGESVQATPRLAAHFYRQERLYPFHTAPAERPGWVILDAGDHFEPSEKIEAFAERIAGDGAYERVLSEGTVSVYRLREITQDR